MINVEFFVNNELIDIIQVVGFPFKLIKTILGQGQLDSRGGTRSYSCELPSTVNNLRILRLNNELNNNQKFYTTLSYDLIINIDSQRFFTGKLYVQSYNKKSISCYFISNNIDWSNLLQGKNLRDLENFEIEFKGMETVLANQQSQNAQSAAVSIGSQEAGNQMAERQMAAQLQQNEIQGEYQSRADEKDKVDTMLGMSQQRLGAANDARAAATKSIIGGVTGLVGSAAGSGLMGKAITLPK